MSSIRFLLSKSLRSLQQKINPSYPKIIQNLIFNNSNSSGVGGVYIEYSTPYLRNNTICNNKGSSVGGVYYWYPDSNTVISNNIIYNINHIVKFEYNSNESDDSDNESDNESEVSEDKETFKITIY